MDFVVPKRFKHCAVQRVRRNFATGVAATVLVTSPGSFSAIIPLYYRVRSSNAATVTFFNGSSGGSIWSGNTIALDERHGPLFDSAAMSAGTDLEYVTAAVAGVGSVELWYIIEKSSGGTAL